MGNNRVDGSSFGAYNEEEENKISTENLEESDGDGSDDGEGDSN
jgi:hypothetical protein